MGRESNYKKQVEEHQREAYKRPSIIETASLRRITNGATFKIKTSTAAVLTDTDSDPTYHSRN